jgi:hypothetical protein
MLISTLPTCILNQTAHIANRKNSAASYYRVSCLHLKRATQVTNWLVLAWGEHRSVAVCSQRLR